MKTKAKRQRPPANRTVGQQSEAGFLLRKLLISHPDFTQHHTWIFEESRWAELAYALVHSIAPHTGADLRTAIRTANDLGLLKIEGLGAEPPDPVAASRLGDLLRESGVSPEEALNGVETLCEAARHVVGALGGNLHLFLRHYGEVMLQQLLAAVPLSRLSRDQAEQAFALWLQNTCNLPISLLDSDVLSFCHFYRIAPSDLIAAADELRLNLALVDDLIHTHMRQKAKVDHG